MSAFSFSAFYFEGPPSDDGVFQATVNSDRLTGNWHKGGNIFNFYNRL
jgi:hypothetical protein